jgi:hypothetical protein
MTISHSVILGSLIAAAISWQSASGAGIGMPAGSKVWMKFEGSACPDADSQDCAGSNQAGPNPPNGIPMGTFSDSNASTTIYAEILPDRIRTFARGNAIAGMHLGGSGFMHASFEDTYTVGGTAAGPFDISVSLHATGFGRSAGTGSTAISHQMNIVNGEAEIGVFQTFTDPALGEGLRVQPFDAQSSATFILPTQAASSPFELPIDITARHTVQNLNVGDTFVLAYGLNARYGTGQVDFLNGGVISFDLPEGVFLTSALAESLLPLAGDYNHNGVVDAADYTVWRDHLGQSFSLTNENPAAATPGVVDVEDYAFWKSHFGESLGSGSGATANAAVPEPATLVLLIFAATGWCLQRRRLRNGLLQLIRACDESSNHRAF